MDRKNVLADLVEAARTDLRKRTVSTIQQFMEERQESTYNSDQFVQHLCGNLYYYLIVSSVTQRPKRFSNKWLIRSGRFFARVPTRRTSPAYRPRSWLFPYQRKRPQAPTTSHLPILFPPHSRFLLFLSVLVCPKPLVQDVYHRQSRAPLRLQGALPDPPPFHLRSPIHACPFPAGKCQELFAEPFLYGIPIIFNYRQSQLVCGLVYGFK